MNVLCTNKHGSEAMRIMVNIRQNPAGVAIEELRIRRLRSDPPTYPLA